jgi:lysophospholipase
MPTSAMAISGGGYKSGLTGIGAYQAIDARYPRAISARTGGLVQCLTYISGLSGGSAIVSTLAANDYPTVAELAVAWNPTANIFTGPNVSNINNYYANIFQTIAAKAEVGFNVSLADVIGILFAKEFILGPNGGINKTFSDIQNYNNYNNFSQGLAPMRILKVNDSTSSYDGIYIPTSNATIVSPSPLLC